MRIIIRKVFEEITTLGGLMFYSLFLFWFLFKGEYFLFIILILGQIIIYLGTLIFRLVYFKHRPEKIKYKSFLEKVDASSFPSIHAARVTFLSIFLIWFIVNDILLIGLIAILAILVFYSRIYLKKHDIVDIIGGILLGIVVSSFFLVL